MDPRPRYFSSRLKHVDAFDSYLRGLISDLDPNAQQERAATQPNKQVHGDFRKITFPSFIQNISHGEAHLRSCSDIDSSFLGHKKLRVSGLNT